MKLTQIPMHHVRANYARLQPAGHWFDRGTMAFFKTKLPEHAWEHAGRVYFVSQETNPSGETRYTVRAQEPNGLILTVGDFHAYATRAQAMSALHNEATK